MKHFLFTYWILLFFVNIQNTHGQYLISGHLETDELNKKVYLSLLQFDEQTTMHKDQVLFSTTIDSSGYFSFTGSLLSDKHKLYRIHANLKRLDSIGNKITRGFDFTYRPDQKNFENFVFSNSDTIVFNKSGTQWFSAYKNTNPVDEILSQSKKERNKFVKELTRINNPEVRKQYFRRYFYDIKSYIGTIQKKHPLATLLLLANFDENTLKEDYEKNTDFYIKLDNRLSNYYGTDSYALQYKAFLPKLASASTQANLNFYKNLNYISAFIILILIGSNIILLKKNRLHKKKLRLSEAVDLTQQEEKIAKLIDLNKSNKEIGDELFISLSTVKTHVRNVYAKFEVNNRKDFIKKYKNQPKD